MPFDGFQNTSDKPKRKPMPRDKHGRQLTREPSNDEPMRRFRENIDVDKLALFMSEHDKYAAFIKALSDPDHARLTFATVCRKFGVSLHELQALYTDGMRHMGLLNMAARLPQVMEDVAEDSLSRQVVCPRCDGTCALLDILERDEKTGKATKTKARTCPVCNGDGTVRQVGDKHARDLVFESMKLTGQKGPMVAIQQNFGSGGDGLDPKMEGMLKMTQQIVMGGGSGDGEKDKTNAG